MAQLNSKEMTRKIKELLGIFDKVGIASKKRFSDVNSQNHPGELLPDFESVIVFAQGSSSNNSAAMGAFDDYFETIAAQSDVIDYLDNLGYTTFMVEGSNHDVSLVRMGIEAGVGEISPVDSLVVKGLGLTASLGAIITNAPLLSDEKLEGVCIKCMKCLRVCPIRDIPNAKGDLSKCACGKCKNSCPV